MEYYKKYRIIENISHAESINRIIHFFHRLPIIGKHTGDKYRLFGLKKFVYTLGPIFSLLGQIIKCLLSFVISIVISGSIIWALHKLNLYKVQEYEDLMDYGAINMAFLSFYLTPALVSDNIEGRKLKIHQLNKQYRMEAKESGLILGVFDPLRISLGRTIIFWILLDFKKAFLISLSLAFIRISSNTYSVYKFSKKEKRLSERFAFIIILEVILFALLMQVEGLPLIILVAIFAISLIAFILSCKYLFSFDGYDRLLEVAKKDSANIDLDYDKIANDSLALKDSDLDKDENVSGRGYDLLNELFFQRHKRLLLEPVIKKATIIFAVVSLGLIAIKFVFTRYLDTIDGLFITSLPILTMLIFNDTESARAFFLNCDRSLMQYGFYRDEKAIFDMYKNRYKSLLKINFLGFIGGILSLLLYYFLYQSVGIKLGVLAAIFILVTYLFFPAFNLFNYYIFQPFNHDASAKGGMYKFMTSLIGYINILIIPVITSKLSGSMDIGFIVLIAVMLVMILTFPLIVRKYGQETFKIRK